MSHDHNTPNQPDASSTPPKHLSRRYRCRTHGWSTTAHPSESELVAQPDRSVHERGGGPGRPTHR